jgi:excisionase family DNA binding protein
VNLDAATIAALVREAVREAVADGLGRVGSGGVGVSPLMTVPEVAELLRTTPKAIYHRVERGQLPGVIHDGDRILVRRTDLLRSLVEGRGSSPKGR